MTYCLTLFLRTLVLVLIVVALMGGLLAASRMFGTHAAIMPPTGATTVIQGGNQ